MKNDFQFIGEDMNQRLIKKSTSKKDYSKYITYKVLNTAFQSYLQLKEQSKTKMNDLKYDSLSIQKYLISELFSQEEKKLMALLRSISYPAKPNFQKMHNRNLKCSLQFNEPETQMHFF